MKLWNQNNIFVIFGIKMLKFGQWRTYSQLNVWMNKFTVATEIFSAPHFPRNLQAKSLPLSLRFSPISIQIHWSSFLEFFIKFLCRFLFFFSLFFSVLSFENFCDFRNELFEALSVVFFATMDEFSELGFSQMPWIWRFA